MKRDLILKSITALLFVLFFIVFTVQGNTEAYGHLVVAGILFFVLLKIYNKYDFPFLLLVGFVIWLGLHLLGLSDIFGERVYGMVLFELTGAPLYFLKYDQLLHFYCYVVLTPIIYFVVKKETKKITPALLVIITLAGIGIGALNEVFEFSMVMLLPNTGVGDYYNNAFDLVMNSLGAILGVWWAHKYSQNR